MCCRILPMDRCCVALTTCLKKQNMYLKLRSSCMPWPKLTKHINIILFNLLDKHKQRKGAVLRKKRSLYRNAYLHIKTNHTISHYIKWNNVPPDNETMLPRKPNRYITDHTVSSTWDTHLVMLHATAIYGKITITMTFVNHQDNSSQCNLLCSNLLSLN